MKGGVDNAAHVGGLLSGFVIGYLYVLAIKKEKQNQQPVNIPIKPSNCVIETIHLDKDRKDLIERASKAAKNIKNKVVTKN